MNLRTAERTVWTLLVGGFLAVVFGALFSPDPTEFLPYAVASLAVGLPVAYWYVGKQLDDLPSEGAGRLTLLFVTLFVASYLGFEVVELVTATESTAETVGRVAAVLVGLHLGRRAAYRGYDRIRRALDTESSS